jgi:GTP cyclohydrolase II
MGTPSAAAIEDWLDRWCSQAAVRSGELGRPLVMLSYAQSLDGSLAAQRGQGLKLSGPEAMRLTHRLRAAHTAILAGIGTVLADDPQLTVRLVQGPSPQPVILDSQLRMPLNSRLMQREDRLPWIFCAPDAPEDRARQLEDRGARVYRAAWNPAHGLNLPSVLAQLGQAGIQSLMVEGGARVLTNFLEQRLFDAVVITIAPVWVGGLSAVERGLGQAGAFPALADLAYALCGSDVVIWGQRNERNLK